MTKNVIKQNAQRQQVKNMLERIVAYLQARFREDPALESIHFPSAHRLCATLISAGVSLWTFSDAGVSAKLYRSCQYGGMVKGTRRNGEWTFYRHNYL